MPRLAGVLLILVVGTSGCTELIPLTPEACPAALLEGTLVGDQNAGIAVHNAEVNATYPVAWPDGWSVRDMDGVRQLMDGSRVVGEEGDRFSAGGGFTQGPDEIFQPCGAIQITAKDD
jgi:hypothetical protein